MIYRNTGEFSKLLVDCLCQTSNFCKYVQISLLNKIPKLKDIFKTVK